MTVAVHVSELTHRYPGAPRVALDGVSFDVPRGECVGLLGPNGAGKTTLMRILCGYLPLDDRGAVTISGLDLRKHSLAVRERVGYLPEQVPLYAELRVCEHLRFRASIKRVPRRQVEAEVQRVAQATGLEGRLLQPIHQLSRGYRQRVGIADALLGNPDIIVLDEPTVGLDPNQVLEIRSMLRDLGGEHTLLFSSHILAEVEVLCDRVVILSEGRVVADEPVADALRATAIRARFGSDRAQAEAIVAAVSGTHGRAAPSVQHVWTDEGPTQCAVTISVDADLGDVSEWMSALGREACRYGVPLLELSTGRTRLEERFVEVTGGRSAQ